MKLKKILAAALSAAMVLSCMTVSGGNVVQAAGRTTDRGVNIANSNNIVCYSGSKERYGIEYVMDHDGNNADNNDKRWLSGIDLKGTGHSTGDAAYIVYDLGENGPRSYQEIHIRFHNRAYATEYKIYTSDKNTYENNDLHNMNPVQDGWRELDSKTRRTDEFRDFPEDVRQTKTGTGRYLLFFFTKMRTDLTGISDSISIREIEIYHKPVDSITIAGTPNLELAGEVSTTTPLTATVTPDNATYKDVTWSSSATNVATVDESGLVTAVAPGTTTITATSKDDSTKKATCEVNVCANKSALRGTISYADTIQNVNNEEYTEFSWDAFQATLEQSKIVLNDSVATELQVNAAEVALTDAILALEKIYTVKVEGVTVHTGKYNTIVKITAPEETDPTGMQFAGWVLDEKVVSLEREYTFAIAGDMNFTKKYISKEQTVEKNLYADVANIIMTKRADGKANIKFIAQLSIPEEYTLEETGLFWTIKDDLGRLYTDNNEPVQGVKKVNSPSISSTYQFAVNVKGLPQGRTIYGVVYAKVTDKNGEPRYVYSDKEFITNN